MSLKFGSCIGGGTYSDVYSATDEDGISRAVKVCYKDGSADGCHCARELDITNRCGKQGGTIKIVKITKTLPSRRSRETPDDFHFVMEKGKCDLLHFLRYENPSVYWPSVRRIMLELLGTMLFIHHRKIIHRDLKPENIIIFDNHGIMSPRVADFGISKLSTLQRPNTPQAVTITYRAPEIALGIPFYGVKSDVWSLGLIFFELATRFYNEEAPGPNNERELLAKIFRYCPLPSKDRMEELFQESTTISWESFSSLYPVKDNKIKLSSSTTSFRENVGNPELFIDLLSHMLNFDWEERYNIEKCLKHPFFQPDGESFITRNSYYLTPYAMKINYTDYPEREQVKEHIDNIITKIFTVSDSSDINSVSIHVLLEVAILADKYYESENKGEFPIEIVMHSLHYLVLKYYYVLTDIPSLSDYFQREFTENEIKQINDFEMFFVSDVCYGRFYVDTMIDYAERKLSAEECRFLLQNYLNNFELKGLTHEEASKLLLSKPST